MRFGVLGPLEVAHGDRAVPIAAGKQAALLVDLLLNGNRTLSLERLVDDLWGEQPPDSAVKAVQVYVSKLRKALPAERLQTRGAGYVLTVRDRELDLDAFTLLAADGRAVLGTDDDRAEALLGEALALWRGPALSGIGAPFAAVEAARLEEQRLACVEDRLEALLGLRRHDEVVSEAEALVARHPLREGLRTLLMLALYRSGRQADALAAYSSFRALLDDDLGIEPSSALRELERGILNQDPVLDAPAPPAAAAAGRRRERPRENGLLERESATGVLDESLADAAAGAGRVALVVGEAGVGKTALVERWTGSLRGAARVLVGSCDPLLTPRALGPVRDIAQQVGGPLAEALAGEGGRDAALDALLTELSDGTTVVVIEDAHWADEATLDVIALLGRRIGRLPSVLVATARPEGLAAGAPLLGSLGDLPSEVLMRVDLAPLSPAAVEALARAAGRPAEGLHERTGGNPFFVSEIIAAGGTDLPPSVRSAVLARCGRLSSRARPVIDLVSVIPGRAELSLVQEIVGPATAEIEECLTAAILTSDGANLRFRHEIARLAVESELSPPRRAELEATVLSALERLGRADLARAVHHARLAGDDDAVRRLAPAAGREAAAAGAHREAVEHFRAAAALVTDREPAERAVLLEALSVEAYLADMVEEALAARAEAVGLRRGLDDTLRTGDGLRWLARLRWWSGDGAGAHEAATEAVAVLEPVGPSRELAMALSGLSQLEGLAWRPVEAIALAERAMALARSFGDEETVVHALTNIGIAKRVLGDAAAGRASLEEAFELASAAGFQDHAGRALAALVASAVQLRDAPLVEADLERSLRYLERHNLDAYRRYALGIRAAWLVEHGEPAAAEADAVESLRGGDAAGITSHPGRVALALIQMRRGDPRAAETLEAASSLARSSNELQRLGPATAALAELAWLDGRLDDVLDEVEHVYRASLATRVSWTAGELAGWLRLGGRLARAPDGAPLPHRLLVEGRWRDAATEYEALGMPYQQALALAQDETPEARAEAIALFERVGASAAAARLRAAPAATARAPSGDGAAGERTLATLIVTDLVDSTAVLSRVGDRAWADLIDRHDTMVREELERHLGREIDSAGDGFLAAFEEPVRAIECGRAIVDRVGSLDLQVRVGIHTGEIERRGQRARGVAVHLVARVAACAAPGEVLVTGTTRDLVAGSGLAFADRGKHELKGIERARRLFALEH